MFSGAGLGCSFELIANIIDQRGFGELPGAEAHDIHAGLARPPAHEVQHFIGVGTQAERRQSAHALRIEEAIGPLQFAALFIHDAERGTTGGKINARDGVKGHGRARSRQRSEIAGSGAGGKEAGRIVPVRQLDAQGFHARMPQLNAQAAGRSLAAAVTVGIETDIDDALVEPAKLRDLRVVEMRSQRRHRIGKTGLPQSRHIEQAFDHDDAGKSE